ncbi:MAG TPA: hypothetical protein VEL31_22400, partial [Ktedonobacteraceae bacterium]|nr:hypothetical protein [Ktedonobacteraceae bacterium]
ITLRQLCMQTLLLFSQSYQFFFNRHAFTLLGLTTFGKSPADLGCYKIFSEKESKNLMNSRKLRLLWANRKGNGRKNYKKSGKC